MPLQHLCLEAHQTFFLSLQCWMLQVWPQCHLRELTRGLTNANTWASSDKASHGHVHMICLLQLVPLNFTVELNMLLATMHNERARTKECCHSTGRRIMGTIQSQLACCVIVSAFCKLHTFDLWMMPSIKGMQCSKVANKTWLRTHPEWLVK